jgi:hypothetical protein
LISQNFRSKTRRLFQAVSGKSFERIRYVSRCHADVRFVGRRATSCAAVRDPAAAVLTDEPLMLRAGLATAVSLLLRPPPRWQPSFHAGWQRAFSAIARRRAAHELLTAVTRRVLLQVWPRLI